MARKKPKLYTADELREIRSALADHRAVLMAVVNDAVRALAANPNKDTAEALAHAAEMLRYAFYGDKAIAQSIEFCEGLKQSQDLGVFDPERCGFTLPEPTQA